MAYRWWHELYDRFFHDTNEIVCSETATASALNIYDI